MGKNTRIFTDVDYEKDGKQVGWLYLPYSVTRSAYGNISIPIAVIKNGRGPTVFLIMRDVVSYVDLHRPSQRGLLS